MVEEALRWYGRIFAFELRGRGEGMAFIDLGDQFIAFQDGRRQVPDDKRHFGLVVEDRTRVRELLAAAGAALSTARSSTSAIPGAVGSRS